MKTGEVCGVVRAKGSDGADGWIGWNLIESRDAECLRWGSDAAGLRDEMKDVSFLGISNLYARKLHI